LEGSVRRAGGKVRVTTQLINAQTDAHLWADTYDRSLDDVFAIQSDIALQVAAQLQAKLSPSVKSAIEQRPTNNLTAYDLYTRAKLLQQAPQLFPDNLIEIVRLLDLAVERDPKFSLAYCTLVSAHTGYYTFWEHTPARRALAERALEKAVRLRPDSGETHLAKAEFFYRCDLNFEKARAELALAQRSLPGESRVFTTAARMDRHQGLWEDAPRNWEKALALDPRNPPSYKQLYSSYELIRQYPKAAATLQRAAAIDPAAPWPRILRGELELHWHANTQLGREIFDELMKENPEEASNFGYFWIELALCERDPDAAERAAFAMEEGLTYDGVLVPQGWFVGLAAWSRGDQTAAKKAFAAARIEAEKTLAEQPDEGPPLCALGLIDAALGRKEEAIQEGRRAAELLPVTKNAVAGAHIQEFLALIYVLCGENDRAIEQLKTSVKPYGTLMLSYGELRLHPFWDPLRGDPRFEKLVASLAPKPGE
jgi:tetratricopeptide (TPR) repeat protein